MERKYESELARTIAQGRKPRKMAVLGFTVISCAIMIGAAAYTYTSSVFAANGGPTMYTVDTTAEDYLVYSDDVVPEVIYSEDPPTDGSYLVKRNATFKHFEFNTPGESPNVYTKYVYVVNIRLKDVSAFPEGVNGLKVCSLNVSNMGASGLIEVTSNFTVNDVEPVLEDPLGTEPSGVTWAITDSGHLEAVVVLPDLSSTDIDYNSEDQVTVFIMWKAPVTSWAGEVTDFPYPDYAVPDE